MDQQHPSPTLSEISHLFLSSVREKQTGGAPLPRRRPPAGSQAALADAAAEAAQPAIAAKDPARTAAVPSPDTDCVESSRPATAAAWTHALASPSSPEMPARTPSSRRATSAETLPASPTPAREAASHDAAPASPSVRHSVDLTPEELAHVFDDLPGAQAPEPAEAKLRIPPLSALLAGHLNDKQAQGARTYARHLAAAGQRIGMIEIDGPEFRLTCFDRPTLGIEASVEGALEHFDARAISDAIEELSWDLDRWLLVLANPRTLEARALLRQVDHWVILSTCDHAGVIASYRMLKGLSNEHRPRLSLALLESSGEVEADSIHRKVAAVCQQFLNWPLAEAQAVQLARGINEHPILCCRPRGDKAQVALAPHWKVVGEFLSRAQAQAAELPKETEEHRPMNSSSPSNASTKTSCACDGGDAMDPRSRDGAEALGAAGGGLGFGADQAASLRHLAAETARETEPSWSMGPRRADMVDVIDLPSVEGQASSTAVLAAILRSEQNELIECPLTPPMCPAARLAVTRQRRVCLLAVARAGLVDLRAIGLAYRWLLENHALLCMALPQMSIDTHQRPHLRLFVDHADLTADVLQPMLQSATVSVEAYRKLRWGNRTGLLLEAA